jgi:hypothetical protein
MEAEEIPKRKEVKEVKEVKERLMPVRAALCFP